MARTLNTEKFLVEVEYSGTKKPFLKLFKPRGSKATVLNITSVEHDQKVLATQSIRTVDQQAVREIIREAVTKAGYVVGNTAKGALKDGQARVDYMITRDPRNEVIRYLRKKDKSNPFAYSIYLPLFFVGVKLVNNQAIVVAAKYHIPKGYKLGQYRTWVQAEYPHTHMAVDGAEYPDRSRPEWLGIAEFCFADPDFPDQLAKYVISLKNKVLGNQVEEG